MIAPDRFASAPAHLRYARGQPVDDALAIAQLRIDDGSWRQASSDLMALVQSFRYLRSRPDLELVILGKLVDDIVAVGKYDDAVHEQLASVVRLLLDAADLATVMSLANWITATAGPGEASLLADVVETIDDHEREESAENVIPADFLPLVHKLFDVGAAELRSSRRASLVSRLVRMVGLHDPDSLGTVLRYFLNNERPAECWPSDDEQGLWPAIEKALEIEYRPDLAVDAVLSAGDAIRRVGQAVILLPLSSPNRLPLCRRALLWALAEGELPEVLERSAVELVMGRPAPEKLTIGSTRVLDLAFDHLFQDAARRLNGIPDTEGWLHLLMSDVLRDRMWHRLLRLTGYELTAPVVGRVVRKRLEDASGDTAALVRAIIDEAPASLSNISAALTLLAAEEEQPAAAPVDAELLEAARKQIESIINFPSQETTFGFDLRAALGPATRIEFSTLDRDDKVRVDGDLLRVERDAIEGIIRGRRPNDQTLALASIYVVHELVHVAQGIGDKERVSRLRATGGETTLMHIDLAADHAAALVVSRAEPRWSLGWLKDLQGRSLDEFPVRWTHTSASRARKAARLVGLRVDYIARQAALPLPIALASGYLFADYGPAGGSLLLMASGPPTSMLGSAPLLRKDAEVLFSAADQSNANPAGLDRVDAVLCRAMATLSHPE